MAMMNCSILVILISISCLITISFPSAAATATTRVDPTWALVQQVNAGINATERAIAEAHRVLNMDDPHNREETFNLCLESYDSVMDSWKDALTSLQRGDGSDVANHLSVVSSMTKRCDDAFSADANLFKDDNEPTVVVLDSPLSKVDRSILNMASNALAIHKMIFPRSN